MICVECAEWDENCGKRKAPQVLKRESGMLFLIFGVGKYGFRPTSALKKDQTKQELATGDFRAPACEWKETR